MAGLLGSGRTETAETIFGVTPHDSGSLRRDGERIDLKSPRDAVAVWRWKRARCSASSAK